MDEGKMPMIYAAICGVMEDVGSIGKCDYNKSQRFRYRGIDAVMNALNPAMIKHKIFCTPEVMEQSREERTTKGGGTLIYSVCKMRYRFYTTDGSYVDAVVVGEGMDSGDKATNKAMSVAFKYACFQTFCIPTENLMDDPDRETPEGTDGRAGKQEGENRRKEKPEDGDRKEGKAADPENDKLLKELENELIRTGYGKSAIVKTYKAERLYDLSKLQMKDAIARLKKCSGRTEQAGNGHGM